MLNHTLSPTELELLQQSVRIIFDYPKKGISFYDITTTLKNPKTLHILIRGLTQKYLEQKIDIVVGIEARGFILGSAVAYQLQAGFVPIRKRGKLPGQTITRSYQSEYAASQIEVHRDAIQKNQRVLLIDDLIATGQTILASLNLIQECDAETVAVGSFIEFLDMPGGDFIRNTGCSVFSLYQTYGNIEYFLQHKKNS